MGWAMKTYLLAAACAVILGTGMAGPGPFAAVAQSPQTLSEAAYEALLAEADKLLAPRVREARRVSGGWRLVATVQRRHAAFYQLHQHIGPLLGLKLNVEAQSAQG